MTTKQLNKFPKGKRVKFELGGEVYGAEKMLTGWYTWCETYPQAGCYMLPAAKVAELADKADWFDLL